MKQKRKSLDELIKAEQEVARRELERWLDIFAHGCSDPCWPDGVNLNLTRNHILAAVHGLRELGHDVSAIFIPPQVNDGLMVSTGKRFEARYKRFKLGGKRMQVVGAEISLF